MLYLVRTEELVFTTRAARRDIDGGKNSFLRQRAIQLDFAVARPLEFFEDDVVHARPCLDQRRGYDSQRASAMFRRHRAGRAEESLGASHRRRIEAAGKRTAG